MSEAEEDEFFECADEDDVDGMLVYMMMIMQCSQP
jgi:hypothetical protein